ncbi:MAG: TIGR02186 family protein [Hyphomicrobiaceae bacterium]|nr:TIGR02186 family protein [Hyphomicrobiaceae bacterium]
MQIRSSKPLARQGLAAAIALLAVALAPSAFAQGGGQWPQQSPQAYPPQQQLQAPTQPQYPQGYGQPQYQGYGQQQPNQQLYPPLQPQQAYPSQSPQQVAPAAPLPSTAGGAQVPAYPSAQQPLQPTPAQQLPVHAAPAQQPAPTQAAPSLAAPARATPGQAAKPTGALQQTAQVGELPKERVEADVSTRSVAITSSFTGTEIVVFGSVENSRQETAESGLYDIAITIEGTATPVVTRKKENVGGLWINTKAQTFQGVPSYYAIVSTRPVSEVAEAAVLNANQIGFEHISMKPIPGAKAPPASELDSFKEAVIRRKQADKLYQKSDYGVAFIGRSLFRSAVNLPANVPVGPLVAHVYLFKDGKLLSKYSSKVSLQREGIERYMHDFAFDYPLFYGIFAVFIAVAAGLIASSLFKKGSH